MNVYTGYRSPVAVPCGVSRLGDLRHGSARKRRLVVLFSRYRLRGCAELLEYPRRSAFRTIAREHPLTFPLLAFD